MLDCAAGNAGAQGLRRILVVSIEAAASPRWQLPEFQLSWVTAAEAPAQLALCAFSAIIVVWTAAMPELGALLAQIKEAIGTNLTPILVAADARQDALVSALGESRFDGFIDLAWGDTFIARCTANAILQLQDGRGQVEIQRQILDVAKGDLVTLQQLVLRDDLTQLHNLRFFREVIQKEHHRCSRHARTYALVFVDLDNLKEINSKHGHASGARVISRVGEAVAAYTRSCDFAFRIGGDEFVVLLVEANKAAAKIYAERLCAAIGTQSLEPGGHAITASAGVAAYPEDGQTNEEVLKKADLAVYEAKRLGKNQVICYRPRPDEVKKEHGHSD